MFQQRKLQPASSREKSYAVVTTFRIQDLKHFIKNNSAEALSEYFKQLLTDEFAGGITKQEIRDLFETIFDENLTGLQWMLTQSNDVMSAQVMLMLMRMQEQGIFTPPEVFQLLVQVNAVGRSTCDYVWMSGSKHARESVAKLMSNIFTRGSITSEYFQQILNPPVLTGRPLLARILHASTPEILAHYFSQWQLSLTDFKACQRYAAALTLPYGAMGAQGQKATRTPMEEILTSNTATPEIMDLYFQQLRLCFKKGALAPQTYFNALSSVKVAGQNTLRYLALYKPDFLERYLQELQFCASKGIASLQDLIEVFRPLAVNGTYSIRKASELLFIDGRVSACFKEILRLNQDPGRLAETLPGLRNFNTYLRFACSFGAAPRLPSPSPAGGTAVGPAAISASESKGEFKLG